MTVRNLNRLFQPTSVALLGASKTPGSLGQVLAQNLFSAGFQGPVMPVHPRFEAVQGVLAFKSVADLPVTPDLAVIATPLGEAPRLIDELGARGTRAAVIASSGFDERSTEGEPSLRQRMLDAAKPYGLRIVGPACLGVMVPGIGLNASYAPAAARPGDLAFIGQSGSIASLMLDWARPRGVGFSVVAALGDMADVDFGDMLDHLALDVGTRAILLVIEDINNARKFMSAARAAARLKPVIVFKTRPSRELSTGALDANAAENSQAVHEAAFRRAGLLPVKTAEELVAAARTLGSGVRVNGNRLAILTNGAGVGALAADILLHRGGRLAELSSPTLGALNAVLPPTWSKTNPVNIFADAPSDRYTFALKAVLGDDGVDAVLVINRPTALGDTVEAARAVVDALGNKRRPVFTLWFGDQHLDRVRAIFGSRQVSNHDTLNGAVASFMQLADYRRNQEMLMETPASVPGEFERDVETARRIVAGALNEGREWLSEPETKDVLVAYGLPVVAARVVKTPKAVAEAAGEIGFPVALKVLSPNIVRKTAVDGVALDLENAAAARAAAERMQRRVPERKSGATVFGFTVQPMVRRGEAYELRLAMTVDPRFGPVILFGQGGRVGRIVKDQAVALPPLNINLAKRLMAETHIHRLLQGVDDHPPAALDPIALALVKLAQLVGDLAEIVEVDINPLLADANGVVALAARMRVARAERPAEARLAIRPYPSELEQTLRLRDGTEIPLRPIRPEDQPTLQEAVRMMSPEDIRLRFFSRLKELDHGLAARLTQIDYEREMAFVALNPKADQTEIWGVVRITADPDGRQAEYAVAVRSDLKGQGLGRALMRAIIDYTRARGIGEIWGLVLTENAAMLRLVRDLGFSTQPDPDEPGVLQVRKRLSAG